jgi:hypothetical protein
MIAPFVKHSFSGKILLPWTSVQYFPDSEVFVHMGNDLKYLYQKDQLKQIECQNKKEPGLEEDKKTSRYPATIITFRVPLRPQSNQKTRVKQWRKDPFPEATDLMERPSSGNSFWMCEGGTQCAIRERHHAHYNKSLVHYHDPRRVSIHYLGLKV